MLPPDADEKSAGVDEQSPGRHQDELGCAGSESPPAGVKPEKIKAEQAESLPEVQPWLDSRPQTMAFDHSLVHQIQFAMA